MIKLPAEVSVVIKSKDHDTALGSVIVYLALKMRRKNDFWFGPFLTGADGTVRLDRAELEERILDTLRDFPMDYVSPKGRAARVSVIIPDADDLRGRIERGRAFYPEDTAKLQAMARTCRNDELPFTEREFEIAGTKEDCRLVVELPYDHAA